MLCILSRLLIPPTKLIKSVSLLRIISCVVLIGGWINAIFIPVSTPIIYTLYISCIGKYVYCLQKNQCCRFCFVYSYYRPFLHATKFVIFIYLVLVCKSTLIGPSCMKTYMKHFFPNVLIVIY